MKTVTLKRSEAIYLLAFIAVATTTIIGQRIENDILIRKYTKLADKHTKLVDDFKVATDLAFDVMVDSCENTIFYSETMSDILDGAHDKTLNINDEEYSDLKKSLETHKMKAFRNLRKLAE